jgi:3-oxoacyl-[acyl-carrier protein] reductase
VELNIAGKAAIVTGASQGLGRAIALELAREGVRTLLVARNAAKLDGLAAEIAAHHQVQAVAKPADLSQTSAAADCVAAAVQALGGIDILVNCAGATKRGDFFELTDADWADGYALKFHGCVRMARAAWPHIAAARGTIINIAGIGARTPSEDFTIGGSVNAALLNFTKALADLGRQSGVRVNAINPGHILSERMEHRVKAAMAKTGQPRDAVLEMFRQDLRVERFGEPAEIGRLVAFLASPASDYIQGASIDIDGGATKGI